jgi:protease-4
MSDSFTPPPVPPPAQPQPPYGYAAPQYATGPYAGKPKRSGWFWFAIVFGILAVVVVGFCILIASMVKTLSADSDTGTSFGKTDSIAVIEVSGVILDADKVDKQLQKFGDDDSVKAIILHINSPGGGAAASQEIYHEVLRVRQQKHKKIVASVESVGASGAYYIASACDKIYANPASVVVLSASLWSGPTTGTC